MPGIYYCAVTIIACSCYGAHLTSRYGKGQTVSLVHGPALHPLVPKLLLQVGSASTEYDVPTQYRKSSSGISSLYTVRSNLEGLDRHSAV